MRGWEYVVRPRVVFSFFGRLLVFARGGGDIVLPLRRNVQRCAAAAAAAAVVVAVTSACLLFRCWPLSPGVVVVVLSKVVVASLAGSVFRSVHRVVVGELIPSGSREGERMTGQGERSRAGRRKNNRKQVRTFTRPRADRRPQQQQQRSVKKGVGIRFVISRQRLFDKRRPPPPAPSHPASIGASLKSSAFSWFSIDKRVKSPKGGSTGTQALGSTYTHSTNNHRREGHPRPIHIPRRHAAGSTA